MGQGSAVGLTSAASPAEERGALLRMNMGEYARRGDKMCKGRRYAIHPEDEDFV